MILGLALLTVLAYSRIWWFGFVYDDLNWVHWAPTIPSPEWPYIAKYPFAFAAWLGGGLPWAFHGVVLALHLVNGLLLWLLARRWLSVSASLVAVTLFWLHPIQTEAVAYVSGGIEVLATTYVLLAILGGIGSGWASLTGGVLALAIGVTLKLSMLPALVLIPAIWLIAKEQHSVIVWLAVCALLYLIGLPALLYWGIAHRADVWTRIHGLNLILLEASRYLALIVYPRWFSIEHTFNTGLAWLAGVGAFGLLAVSVALRRIWLAPFLCLVWMAAWILPRGLVSVQAIQLTEHHCYLLFLPIWLLAGSFLDHFVLKGQTAHG